MKLVYISFIQAEKLSFLRTVCRHVANTLCRPDADSLLVRLGARDMSLEASDLSVSTLSRTFASLYKTKQKVGLLFRRLSGAKRPPQTSLSVYILVIPLVIKRLYIMINLCCQSFNIPKVDLFDPVCLGGSSLFVQQNAEQAQARSLDNDLSHDSLSFIEVQTLR